MKTAFIFHGTEGYPEENWFPWLKQKLEQHGYETTVPQFPSPPIVPSDMDEWFAVWEPLTQKLDEHTIIAGHSLGGKFLLRVLERLTSPVRAAAFVGTPIGIPPIANNERDNAFTGNDFDWDAIRRNAQHFIVFQSDDDPYVGLGNGTELAKHLGVQLSFVPGAGHFNAKAGYTRFEALWHELKPVLEK